MRNHAHHHDERQPFESFSVLLVGELVGEIDRWTRQVSVITVMSHEDS
jgi:hypothetical protein